MHQFLSNARLGMEKHQRRFSIRVSINILWMTVAAFFAGCGGGGGATASGGPTTEVTPPPPPPSFSVGGSIEVRAGMIVDSDVNDSNASYVANDGLETAQPIPGTAVLGGYVNEPGFGAAGRSQQAGDPIDFFVVDLAAGQHIELRMADWPNVDLDMMLLDEQGYVVDWAIDTTDTEHLFAPTQGRYVIGVYPYSGASNYALDLRQSNPDSAPASMRLSTDFVPGQVVARFTRQMTAKHGNRLLANGRTVDITAGDPDRGALMQLRPGSKNQSRLMSRSGPLMSFLAEIRFANAIDHEKFDTLMAVKDLRTDDGVTTAEPNYVFRAFSAPNDPRYAEQWNYPLIDLPAAWDVTAGSPDVVVAVVDTGVLVSHPDMQGQLVPGFDFVSDAAYSLDGDGIDDNPDDPGTSGFHGTHVAGTIAAASNNSVGVAGIAWQSRIMPLRALGEGGSGTYYDIMQSVRFAAGLDNDSGTLPQQRADIINMSLGGPGIGDVFQSLIHEVRANGVIVVAAAGNSSTTEPMYPAAYDGVVSVSAAGPESTLAYYSNFGSTVDVAAPGGGCGIPAGSDCRGVLSTAGTEQPGSVDFDYQSYQGTSMAAPHVAGVFALMKSVNSSLTPADIDELLRRGELTDADGRPACDIEFGSGLINARKAVDTALAGPVDAAPELRVCGDSVSFGPVLASVEIRASNVGGGQLQVTEVSVDAPWAVIVAGQTDERGIGTYVISIDRSALEPGEYTATATISSNASSVQVPVSMSVPSFEMSPDAGHQYVLLLNSLTDETEANVALSAQNGVYHYQFDGIEEGSYRIVSGSDSDNDGSICDEGETCGAFGPDGEPEVVVVDRDHAALNFAVGFDDLQTAATNTPALLRVRPDNLDH